MKIRVLIIFLLLLHACHHLIAQPVMFPEKGDYNVLLMVAGKKPDLVELKTSMENQAKKDQVILNIQVLNDKKYFPTDANKARSIGENVNANLVIWIKDKILTFTQVTYKGESSIEQGSFLFSQNCLIASVFSNYYYDHRDFNNAINNLINLKECSDTVFSTHWMLANSYYEINDTAKAMLHTKKLFELNKYSDIASNLMGILYGDQGNFEKARNYFFDARVSKPKNPLYLNNLAMTCYKMEKWDYAFIYYKELSQIWTDSLNILFMAGMSVSHLGGYEESSVWFEKILQLNDTSVIAHFNQAHNMHMLGKFDRAIFHYSRVIELNKTHANAHLGLAYIYAEIKMKEELKTYYQKAIHLNPALRNVQFEEEFGLNKE